MNTSRSLAAILFFTILNIAFAQTFNVNAYKQFLSSHANLTPEQLRTQHPVGDFKKSITLPLTTSLYRDSIQKIFSLTEYEQSLLNKHGFVVSERLQYNSFGEALYYIYAKDLPVFISTDAILHALHMSYDKILMDVESSVLIPKLTSLLNKLHQELRTAAVRYDSLPDMKQQLMDVDVYLTLSRRLLQPELSSIAPVYGDNTTLIASLLTNISTGSMKSVPLFSSTNRDFDFSQFTPRGHYTRTPQLTAYFQAMIWLGRTELYLSSPKGITPQQTDADIQRQTIDACFIAELVHASQTDTLLQEIDGIIRMFVGEQDNVTVSNIALVMQKNSIAKATDLLDTKKWISFKKSLLEESFAFQRINSQILISDPMSPDKLEPASSFLLLGQRFVIDSYVTWKVVYDNILYNNVRMKRMLPSTLDVLFALGNNASAILLDKELQQYKYSSNLSAVRYLIDSYESEFWNSSLYNSWLNSIRSLNAPQDKSKLPLFMQTAAWWQEKMNTQLASWAELRHDNLLYAKQSYTGGITCSYPEAYVEPIPQFYSAIKTFADNAGNKFQQISFSDSFTKDKVVNYFSFVRGVADTLGSIAQKHLSLLSLSSVEKKFIDRMLFNIGICGLELEGWYAHLYYGKDADRLDKIVADIHTAPTDESGNVVGWVVHVGTGLLNLAIVTAQTSDGKSITFVGPVMSYYEHVSTNFKRLTDEEWKTTYNIAPSFRPPFVNVYLADISGLSRGDGPSLVTSVEQKNISGETPTRYMLGQNYPNPFNPTTIIPFSIPSLQSNENVRLLIYNVQGQLIKELLNKQLPSGNYTTRWDGTTTHGVAAASGVYFYHLIVGNQRLIGKMNLLK